VKGAARDFVYVFQNGKRAAKLCRLVTVAKVGADRLASIVFMLGSLSSSETWRLASCRRITTRYAYACVQGAQSVPPLPKRV
jgi:hypothetical protein